MRSGRMFNLAQIQWQPITYGTGAAHDPSPPIILEDAPTIPPSGGGNDWPIFQVSGFRSWRYG